MTANNAATDVRSLSIDRRKSLKMLMRSLYYAVFIMGLFVIHFIFFGDLSDETMVPTIIVIGCFLLAWVLVGVFVNLFWVLFPIEIFRLSEDGIVYRRLLRSYRLGWYEIENVYRMAVRQDTWYGKAIVHYLCIRVEPFSSSKNSYKPLFKGRLYEKLGKPDVLWAIQKRLDLTPAEVLQLVKDYRKKYRS